MRFGLVFFSSVSLDRKLSYSLNMSNAEPSVRGVTRVSCNAIGPIVIDASEFWKLVGRLSDKAENLVRGTLRYLGDQGRSVGREVPEY